MANTTLTLSSGSVTLTGSGTIATSTSGTATAGSVDAYRVGSARLIYCEYTYNVRVNANTGAGFGVAGSAYATLGTANTTVMVRNDGNIFENGVSVGVSLGALVNGDVICYALDFNHGFYWVRKNAGIWLNSATADPAVGTGGRSIPIAFVAPLLQLGATSEQITANFGTTAFAQTVPSGYTSGWAAPGDPTALLDSQVGVEAYYQANSADSLLMVSQVGVEVWRSTADLFTSALIVSQVGVEVWTTTANIPPPPPANGAALLIGL